MHWRRFLNLSVQRIFGAGPRMGPFLATPSGIVWFKVLLHVSVGSITISRGCWARQELEDPENDLNACAD